MARKRYKRKLRACGLCRPHKTGRSNPLVFEGNAAPSPVRADPSSCRRLGQPVNRPMILITQPGTCNHSSVVVGDARKGPSDRP
jgi:hypothetical protein